MSLPPCSVCKTDCSIASAALHNAPRHAHRQQPALYVAAMALYHILAESTDRVSCSWWSTHGHNDRLSSMHLPCVSLLPQVGGGGEAESPRLQNRADPGPGHTAGAARAGGLPTQVSSREHLTTKVHAFGISIQGFQKGNSGMASTAETGRPLQADYRQEGIWPQRVQRLLPLDCQVSVCLLVLLNSKVSSERIRLSHPHLLLNDTVLQITEQTQGFPLSVTCRLCSQQSPVFYGMQLEAGGISWMHAPTFATS